MAANTGNGGEDISYNAIKKLLAESEYPALTATDVAEQFGVTRQAARYRLRKLIERGEVESRKVGGAAVIYWLSSESDADL